MKVLLILIDGMRPDAICDNAFIKKLIRKGSHTFSAKTVVPPVTLPCHMSLFHSVEPVRHGVTTNIYTPPVHDVKGLFEHLYTNKKKCAAFYNWEQLRDISRPGCLAYSYFLSYFANGLEKTDEIATDRAIEYIKTDEPDFVFLYIGDVDEVGHKYGWMSAEYLKAVDKALENAERIVDRLPDAYSVIITADHGGHDRLHGVDMPEDMTIPVFMHNVPMDSVRELEGVSILDIAPTIARLCGVEIPDEWEGNEIEVK